MTKTLTTDQQKFLNKLLQVRPQTKSPLGGRKLGKIKDQFADYLRRRRKTAEAIEALETAYGPQHGLGLRRQLESACGIVEAGANTGDETVFAVAYAELENVKKAARGALDHLQAQAREIASASEKFEQAFDKVQRADGGKRAALARSVVESCAQWLARHPDAVAPRVNSVMEQAQALTNTPLSREQGFALGTHLSNETGKLCQEIDGTVARGLYASSNLIKGYDGQMTTLLGRLDRALVEARASGSVVAINQIQRASAQLKRTQLLASPPPLDVQAPVLPLPDSGPGKLLGARLEDLTDEEQADRALLKSSALLDQAREELKRIREGMAHAEEGLRSVRIEFSAYAVVLGDDIALIADSLSDANVAVLEADAYVANGAEQIDIGRSEKAKPGAWEDALELVAMACDLALANLSTADKAMGRAEGGVVYVRNKAGAFASIPRRITALDQGHLDKVQANIGVFADCDKVPKTAGDGDVLKHLVVVSDNAEASRALVLGITDAKSYAKQVQALMNSPKLGTQLVTQLISDCHTIVIDCERYLGDVVTYKNSLDKELKARFDQIVTMAKRDAARFTVPVIARKPNDGVLVSVGVAVVGGGPVGLLAAVEARMAGASQVHVYEGRSDEYSRLNVLAIDPAAVQRFKAIGVFEQIFPDPNRNSVSVKNIEMALEQRCQALGVKLERDRFLLDVKRDEKGVVNLTFKGDPTPRTCDFLIVATGGSVASAQRHANNVVLGDKLGIPFQKSEVKDYASVGLFKKDAKPGDDDQKPGGVRGWNYNFETTELKYVVSQLTEEEFREMSENPRKLVERVQQTGKAGKQDMRPEPVDPTRGVASIEKDGLVDALDAAWDKLLLDFGGIDNFHGKDKAQDIKSIRKCHEGAELQLTRTIDARIKKGEEGKVSPAEVEKSMMNLLLAEFGVSRFPIEIQQAQNFTSSDGSAVLVGDSAATPHPATSKGLNTGIAEMGAMRDLIQDLQRTGGDEAKRKEALQVYDFEVKRRTDMMVGAALDKLQEVTRSRINSTYAQRISPQLSKWRGGQEWGMKTWKLLLDTRMKDLSVSKDDAKEDRDWARREAATKSLRALLSRLEDASRRLGTRNDVLLADLQIPVDQDLPQELKTVMGDVLSA